MLLYFYHNFSRFVENHTQKISIISNIKFIVILDTIIYKNPKRDI